MSQREDVFVVQFATALSPTITLLQIATVLCAGAFQELLLLYSAALVIVFFPS